MKILITLEDNDNGSVTVITDPPLEMLEKAEWSFAAEMALRVTRATQDDLVSADGRISMYDYMTRPIDERQ